MFESLCSVLHQIIETTKTLIDHLQLRSVKQNIKILNHTKRKE